MRRVHWRALALVAALAVLVSAAGAAASWVTVAPPDGGFSAAFPGQPEFRRVQKSTVETRIWLARTDALLCVVGVTDYDAHVNAERELELDMKNFLKETSGTLTSRKRVTFTRAPNGKLPALEFTYSTASATGRSLVVVNGDRAYQVLVQANNGYDGRTEMAHVLNSLRITVPPRHWQGD